MTAQNGPGDSIQYDESAAFDSAAGSPSDQAFRAGHNHARWPEMAYAGTTSFLRRRYTRDLDGVDVAVTGIPYDAAVTYRPGCRLGPRAIRAASVQLAELKAFPSGYNLAQELSIIDYGDCHLNPHIPETVIPSIEAHATRIIEGGTRLLSFGGDHFVAYPLLKAHARQYGPVAFLQFDAHCDTWEDPDNSLDHGTMFGRAVREGLIDTDHAMQVGIRTYNDHTAGFEILTAPWVHRNGIDATLQRIHDRMGQKPLYISFDIDVLDPAFAPGTGTPVCGGLTSWQALELIRGLAGLNLIGMDLVEVSPPFDQSEITALAAATLAHDWLCVLAANKGAVARPTGEL